MTKIRKAGNRVSCAGAAVFLITLLWGIQPASAEWGEWIADAELGVLHNDNINQSLLEFDERSDSVFLPSIALGRYYQLMDTTRLRLTANSWGRAHKTFDRLNSITSGITVGMVHKFGLGSEVPWIRADAYVGYMDVRDDVRDGMHYTMDLRVGKRFTPRLNGSLGYEYSLRDGGDGEVTMKNTMHGIDTDVYDQKKQTLSLEANYLITNYTMLTAGYSYRYGDFDSACTPDNFEILWPTVEKDVEAIASDKVFDGFVYRLKGWTNVWSLNLSYALSGHASLNLGYQYKKGELDDLSYTNSIVQAVFMYRY